LENNHEKFCCTEIKNISVKKPDITILEDVNLHIHCKELTVIIGKNGAGKSTLLKSILGEVKHSGTVSFKSKHNSKDKLTIGYVPQKLEVESSPMSVYDLICSSTKGPAVFFRRSKKKYEEIQNHLKEFGIDKLIDKRVCDLSGGELQRVLIAMATMPYPELLIMDEPVSGIDAKGKKEFYKLIKKIKEKHDIAILLVSHDFEYIREYADKVVLLNRKVLKTGNPEEVLSSEEFMEEFKVGMV